MFAILTLLSALSLAGVAGWFSIIGVMSIYAGAQFHALIMGIVLEAGKLVVTSWLYRNWTFSSWKLKLPLIVFTLTLMLATSIGVFGFLSKAHLEQGSGTIDNTAKVERLEQQIVREKSTITDDEKVIGQLDATINSYIGKDRTDKSVSIRKSQTPQRNQLRSDIDAAQRRIDGFSDEKFKLQAEVRKLQLDVGPIRYIAELIYGADGNADKKIEAAVRIFTLIIVSTLDPLAVILLIAANHTILRLQNEKDQKNNEKIDTASIRYGINESAIHESFEETKSSSGHSTGRDDSNAERKSMDEESDEVSISNIPNVIVSWPKIPNRINETENITVEENNGYETPVDSGDSDQSVELHIPHEDESVDIITSTKDILDSTQGPDHPNNLIDYPDVTWEDFPSEIKSLPIIRTPKISTVSDDTTVNSHIFNELVGYKAGPHFIPKKLNEEEKSSEMAIGRIVSPESMGSTPTSEATTATVAEEVRSIEQEETFSSAEDDSSAAAGEYTSEKNSSGSKIRQAPRSLSWLKEFKGSNNGR